MRTDPSFQRRDNEDQTDRSPLVATVVSSGAPLLTPPLPLSLNEGPGLNEVSLNLGFLGPSTVPRPEISRSLRSELPRRPLWKDGAWRRTRSSAAGRPSGGRRNPIARAQEGGIDDFPLSLLGGSPFPGPLPGTC